MLWSATEEEEEEEDEEELGKIANVRQPKHRPGMAREQTSIGTPVRPMARSVI